MSTDNSDFYDLKNDLGVDGEEVAFNTTGFNGHGRIYNLYEHDMMLVRKDSGKGNGYHIVTAEPVDFRVRKIALFVNGTTYTYYCRTAAPRHYLAQIMEEYPDWIVKEILHKEDYELYLKTKAGEQTEEKQHTLDN